MIKILHYAKLFINIILIIIKYFGSFRRQPIQPQTTNYGCYFNVTKGDVAKVPIILNTRGSQISLTVPKNGLIRIKKFSTIILHCSGKNNFLDNVNVKSTEAICDIRNRLNIDNRRYTFSRLQCVKKIMADLKNTKRICGKTGREMLIGYQFRDIRKSEFVTLINVCYDDTSHIPLYSYHLLYGELIKHAVNHRVSRGKFRQEGLLEKVKNSYKISYQLEVFSRLLGEQEARKYINSSSFLSAGHLTPPSDFLLASSQRATNFYLNACPQWITINNRNWKRLEMAIRKTVEFYNKTFKILTGTYNILQLPNCNKRPRKIYLNEKKTLPVPKYLWKILYDLETFQGIALIVVNNPFWQKGRIEFCKNVCKEYRWNLPGWKNVQSGYVFCCTVPDMLKKATFIPRLSIKGVLSGIF